MFSCGGGADLGRTLAARAPHQPLAAIVLDVEDLGLVAGASGQSPPGLVEAGIDLGAELDRAQRSLGLGGALAGGGRQEGDHQSESQHRRLAQPLTKTKG
jgi:hypothetical protein